MPRKIFWGLWMTVWPAVALIPPLVTAQATRPMDSTVTGRAAVLAPVTDTQPTSVAAPADQSVVELSLEPAAARPQSAVPVELPTSAPPVAATPVEPRTAPVKTVRKSPEAITAISDANLFEDSEPLPATPSTGAVAPRRMPSRQVTPRRSGPPLSAQEQTALKLIQERAMLRAQQRHSRLEMKQGGGAVMPRRPVRQTTAWQPQLTQPDWLAEMDQITNP